MKDIKRIAQNLGKTGMPAKKIADVLEEEVHLVEAWLEEGGVDPRDYKDAAYQRQMDGIAAAKARGIRFGRPKVEMPDNFGRIVMMMDDKKILAKDAVKLSGLAEATFYRRLREYRKSLDEEN